MCEEYENELVRMGLVEDAETFPEERAREHEATEAVRPLEGERALREAAQGSRK